MEREGIMFTGVRDGGVIKHRNNSPFVINTFFSILNFKELKRIWNRQEMLAESVRYMKMNLKMRFLNCLIRIIQKVCMNRIIVFIFG